MGDYAEKTKQQNPELVLQLTDEQRRQIVDYIAQTRSAKLEVDVLFEATVENQALAPSSVLVGNAI